MAVTKHTHRLPHSLPRPRTDTRPGFAAARWALTVTGAVAIFLGLFIMVGGEDRYVGLGGEASWRATDIHPAWAWGLLLGGAAVLLAGVLAFVAQYSASDVAGHPGHAGPRAGLIMHATAFVLVNAFLWTQDILMGGGVDYAWLITLPWAVGLAAHVIAYRRAAAR